MIIQDEMLRAAIARTLQIEEADITEKKAGRADDTLCQKQWNYFSGRTAICG